MIVTRLSVYLGNINFIFLKKKKDKYIYLYTDNIYFFIKITNINFFNQNSKTLSLVFFDYFVQKKGITNYWNFFFKNWQNLFFRKIKFKGKGYKIKKKNKKINFFFGRAHLTSIWFKGVYIKRLNKYKLFVAAESSYRLYLIHKFIDIIRKLNVYTRRGLRLSRQKVLKKVGKKSSYV